MENYVGIYDENPVYARRLMAGLLAKSSRQWQTVEFTRPENIEIFCQNKSLELLLVAKSAYSDDMQQWPIGRVICLCEEEPDEKEWQLAEEQHLGLLFKYQPLSALLRELLTIYRPLTAEEATLSGERQLIGVYSPVGRCGKTRLAVALAEQFGEEKPTLFITFEEYSWVGREQAAGEGDLMDAMYYYLQGELAGKEKRLARRTKAYDYLAPARTAEDLRGLKAEEVTGFLQQLLAESVYGYIVVDVGQALGHVEQILPVFSRVFLPYVEEVEATWRKEAFARFFTKQNMMPAERITPVCMPEPAEGVDLSAFVRRCRTCPPGQEVTAHG